MNKTKQNKKQKRIYTFTKGTTTKKKKKKQKRR